MDPPSSSQSLLQFCSYRCCVICCVNLLPANSALNQSRALGPWHSVQAFSALRCIAYSQGRLTDWDQKFQIFLMNASLKNYQMLVSLQDKMEHRRISLPTGSHSYLLSGMVGLWLWAPARFHWVGEAVLCAKRAEIPTSISAEYYIAVTGSFAQADTALNCWVLKCQLNHSSFSFSADCQVETSGLFHISSNVGQNNSKIKGCSNVQISLCWTRCGSHLLLYLCLTYQDTWRYLDAGKFLVLWEAIGDVI